MSELLLNRISTLENELKDAQISRDKYIKVLVEIFTICKRCIERKVEYDGNDKLMRLWQEGRHDLSLEIQKEIEGVINVSNIDASK